MTSEPVALEFTSHAVHVLAERAIRSEWVERVVAAPASRMPGPNDAEVERFFGSIAERDGRALRVVVSTHAVPWRVVSAFFDRNMRGEA